MRKKIAIVAAVLVTVGALSGCTNSSKAQNEGQSLTEQAFQQQSAAVPYPADQLKDSLERRNIKERLLRTNNPELLGYVYLMNFGQIVGYYSVKGKITSNQSQMTTSDLIASRNGGDAQVVAAPGDDGSYGENEPGIFFFTTEGAFVTTSLDYIWSDQPLPIDTPRLNSK